MARPLDEGHGRCCRWLVGASLALTALLGTTLSSPTPTGAATLGATTTWAPLSPATSPPFRALAAMAYDAAINRVVLFGGTGAFYQNLLGTVADTWTYNGTTWAEQSPATSPPARYEASMAFDPALGQLVLFGGLDVNDQALNDTWTYNGITWIKQTPTTSPPARSQASMAYDPAIGQLVLFGGTGANSQGLADTWTYNGTTWTEQSPATVPSARTAASMAYDPATRQLVLFGGQPASYQSAYGDTWTYNGSTWAQLSPANSPSPRGGASMAYDPANSELALVGGMTANGHTVGDTWSYNGTTWVEQSPVVGPGQPYLAPMDYDPTSGHLVLFNGSSFAESGAFAVMWAYQVVGDGYWLAAKDGAVSSFGAPSYGSLANAHLNQPTAGIAAAPGGDGYFLVGKDGRVSAFGDAELPGLDGRHLID